MAKMNSKWKVINKIQLYLLFKIVAQVEEGTMLSVWL